MIYPKKLKRNDYIKIISPSNGVIDTRKTKMLDMAIEKLKKYGFQVFEDYYTRTSINGASTTGVNRASELIKNIKDKEIKYLLAVSGGDYLIEIFDYLNFDEIKNNTKWIQGHSDITPLLYYITVKYDVATIYSFNATTFGNESVPKEQLDNNINILKGHKVKQTTFDNKYISCKCINKNKNLKLTGRIIGGCLDSLLDIVGTKYDFTNKFIEKYMSDGIIWYFDVFDLTNEDIYRGLWQLKNANWFVGAKCIILGRLQEERTYTKTSLENAILKAVESLDIPIIINADIGHTDPRFTIVNGSLVKIDFDVNKISMKMELK